MIYPLHPSLVWNPLLKLPRNKPCPCGSGKKFKVCHLRTMERVLDPKSIPVPKKSGGVIGNG